MEETGIATIEPMLSDAANPRRFFFLISDYYGTCAPQHRTRKLVCSHVASACLRRFFGTNMRALVCGEKWGGQGVFIGESAIMFAIVIPVSILFTFLAVHLSPDDQDSMHDLNELQPFAAKPPAPRRK